MKYVICIDQFSDKMLTRKSIKVIKAVDPSMALDTVIGCIAAENKYQAQELCMSRMGEMWYKNNLPNNKNQGCYKVRHYKYPNVSFILFYRAIRESDLITVKEKEEDD